MRSLVAGGFVAGLVLVCMSYHWLLQVLLLGDRAAARDGLEQQLAQVRAQGALAHQLAVSMPGLRARVQQKVSIWQEVRKMFLIGGEDKLWVVDLHERMRKRHRQVSMTLAQAARTAPLDVGLPSDVGSELTALSRLRGKLALRSPGADAPAGDSGAILEARFQVSGPYASVVNLVRDLQAAQPEYLELTRIEASCDRPLSRGDDRLLVKLTVTALALSDPEKAHGP